MNELALFAGAGGGILGGKLLGWRTVCAVEIDPYARRVLLARQADGCLEPFPIWDDVTTFDGHPWRGRVDVVSGGFPCQDISAAGNGAGLDGERSGLWAEFARIIGEVQPAFVWVENSPMLLVRGIDRVLWDLAALGYDARWGVVGACHSGAPHRRERVWIMGHPMQGGCTPASLRTKRAVEWAGAETLASTSLRTDDAGVCGWWKTEPRVGRLVDGVASGMDELAAIGNGQVPAVVRLAWKTLMGSSLPNAKDQRCV
jgi:DNA (cytosine-5)-methyltransferase 1